MSYYIAETNANDVVNNNNLWTPVNAKTLTAAKQAASRAQTFQGTSLHVAIKNDNDEFVCVAVRRADALDMNLKGQWRNL